MDVRSDFIEQKSATDDVPAGVQKRLGLNSDSGKTRAVCTPGHYLDPIWSLLLFFKD